MNIITLPGLIDVHVHLRDPGQTEKEDFFTGTSAALAGGFTTIVDMPNNKVPIISFARLKEKITLAKGKIVCDVGFYAGSMGDNPEELQKMEPSVVGLKLYLNKTTGNFIIDKKTLENIFSFWKSEKPILLHAEEDILPDILQIVKKTKKRVHVCHVSKKSELTIILKAKQQGSLVTCGVTPHHLFLTNNDVKSLGNLARMKPELGTKVDQDYLWSHLSEIDIIESDHAPHTLKEKQSSTSPYGVPNLDTTLPLLLTAVSQNRLSLEDIIRLCYTNPASIFAIPTDKDTRVEIDTAKEYTVTQFELKSKCGWSPYTGWKVRGKVKNVFIRGQKVFSNGELLVKPGFGRVIHTL